MDDTVLYVEPIYLQSDTAAYPELRIVAVMHGDELSYASSFEEALEGLYGEAPPPEERIEGAVPREEAAAQAGAAEAEAPEPTEARAAAPAEDMPEGINELIDEANNAFDTYFDLLGQKEYGEASRELDRLERLLNQLSEQSGGAAQ
jgi:hypothetical protein